MNHQIDSSLLNVFVLEVGVLNNVNNRNGAAQLLKNAKNGLRYHRLNATKKFASTVPNFLYAKDSKAIKEILINKRNARGCEVNSKQRGDTRLHNFKESNIHVDIGDRSTPVSSKDYSASIPMHSTSTLTSSILKSAANVISELPCMLTKIGNILPTNKSTSSCITRTKIINKPTVSPIPVLPILDTSIIKDSSAICRAQMKEIIVLQLFQY
ncbi:hypothetical protein GIB67_032499 [Kingdonia uniflora]|uniref:Uncharacterized protein n=1 Tax=Kingdonia uniflora TaxID=39325 RepID=A0A7J7L7H4_9MAGN|nr:hypothetical protein GIB67_032499 [Kingdonia uniflora]